jgi:CBS domain-containing protein
MICPDCGYENMEGADFCEQCGQPLTSLPKKEARTPIEECIVRDRIRDLSPREPLVVEPDATVAWVLKLLYDHKVGCAVVVDPTGVPVGIFSERDALMRLGVNARAMADRPIADFMTREPETLEEKDKIVFALHRMDLGGFRHIPILADGHVTGVISVRDVLRYLTDHLAVEPA